MQQPTKAQLNQAIQLVDEVRQQLEVAMIALGRFLKEG